MIDLKIRKNWLLACVLKDSTVAHCCFFVFPLDSGYHCRWQTTCVNICLLFCFRSLTEFLSTTVLSWLQSPQRYLILFSKLSTSGGSFSKAKTACVITDRSILCGVSSQLTLLAQEMMRSMQPWHWQTPERQQLHSLEKLSISSVGWLCPVIFMLPRLWHLYYEDGKCLSNHLLAAQFEFFINLDRQSWRFIIMDRNLCYPAVPGWGRSRSFFLRATAF